VFYIDFGNQEKVKLSRIRPLPPGVLSYPCQAFACSLAEVGLPVFFLNCQPAVVFCYCAQWNVFPTTSSYCWRNHRYRPVSSRHSPLIDLCGVMSVKMVLPHSLSTTIKRQKLAGFVANTISWPPTAGPCCHICDRICASDFRLHSHLRIHNVCPQLASTASLSTSTDSYKQRSKCAIVQ